MINASREDVYCFVTRFNGGSDEWFKVRAGYRDSWGRRNGWELVAFTDADDCHHTCGGVRSRVFHRHFPQLLRDHGCLSGLVHSANLDYF